MNEWKGRGLGVGGSDLGLTVVKERSKPMKAREAIGL